MLTNFPSPPPLHTPQKGKKNNRDQNLKKRGKEI